MVPYDFYFLSLPMCNMDTRILFIFIFINFLRYLPNEFFSALSSGAALEGVELIEYFNDVINPLYAWRPNDIVFIDAIDVAIQGETFKVRPGGSMYWSRHFVASVKQAGFTYTEYPDDSQRILLEYYSFTYSNRTLTQSFGTPAMSYLKKENVISFVNNPVSIPHLIFFTYDTRIWQYLSYVISIMLSQIWSHTTGDYTAQIEIENRPTTVSGVYISRWFVKCNLNIRVSFELL